MSNFRANSNPPFSSSSSSSQPPFGESVPTTKPRRASAQRGRTTLHEGWRRLSTGIRGAHLYVVTLPTGGAYWLADVIRNGARLSRRFASELHARAWMLEALNSHFASSSFDWEELNGNLRAAFRNE